MILYIENPKDATRKLLELINEFGKVAGYKINAIGIFIDTVFQIEVDKEDVAHKYNGILLSHKKK